MNVFKGLDDPRVIALLKDGAVGVLPTDTVYGLVACANMPKACKKVLLVKGRKYKPGTMIAASVQQILDLGVALAEIEPFVRLWPAPLSVVVAVPPALNYLHVGQDTVPIRIPNKPELLRLLQQTGPLITTSANLPDQPPAQTIAEAIDLFGDKVGVYVDGGTLAGGVPSTIVKIQDNRLRVFREGAFPVAKLPKLPRSDIA